jgi:serine phosphatase RsbU (regulator of sigma subunit)
LGEGPESVYEQFGYELQPGEVMVLCTDGVRDATRPNGRPLGESGVAEMLGGRLDLTASELVTLVRQHLEASTAVSGLRDRSVLVIKRRGG